MTTTSNTPELDLFAERFDHIVSLIKANSEAVVGQLTPWKANTSPARNLGDGDIDRAKMLAHRAHKLTVLLNELGIENGADVIAKADRIHRFGA